MVRVTGPIVAGLQTAFMENWLEATGELAGAGCGSSCRAGSTSTRWPARKPAQEWRSRPWSERVLARLGTVLERQE